MSSCDRINSVVSDVVNTVTLPSERRKGINKPYEASADAINQWLAEPNVVVVLNFYSSDSKVCDNLNSKLRAMAKKYAEHSAIMNVNVGQPSDAATVAVNEYKIDKTPVLKFFLNGKEVKELAGDQTTKTLETVFSKYTKKVTGKFTMREGVLPGMQQGRAAEDMMIPTNKSELPDGITRVKVPDNARQITDGLPRALNGTPPDSEKSDKSNSK